MHAATLRRDGVCIIEVRWRSVPAYHAATFGSPPAARRKAANRGVPGFQVQSNPVVQLVAEAESIVEDLCGDGRCGEADYGVPRGGSAADRGARGRGQLRTQPIARVRSADDRCGLLALEWEERVPIRHSSGLPGIHGRKPMPRWRPRPGRTEAEALQALPVHLLHWKCREGTSRGNGTSPRAR